ncbi:MAG: hypothetical protein DMF62_04675 [Acidobacteria bacterium]|nr:MAG: hypothetical protein DMF62_04675 [Acidobacteriota bacterium]
MIEVDDAEYEKMRQDLSNALGDVEKLKTQLEACGLAAQGVYSELPRTAYGWSSEFERVCKLRRLYEAWNAKP